MVSLSDIHHMTLPGDTAELSEYECNGPPVPNIQAQILNLALGMRRLGFGLTRLGLGRLNACLMADLIEPSP